MQAATDFATWSARFGDVLADFRAAATDEAARAQRDLSEARDAAAAAQRYNPTADMRAAVAAVAECQDTASLVRVAGALLQAILAKDWPHSDAHMMWACMQDVLGDLKGLCDRDAEELAA